MFDKSTQNLLTFSMIAMVTISGYLGLTNEEKVTHSGSFEEIDHNYVLIPVVQFQNNTFADIDNYKFEKGKGTFSMEEVEGYQMINISSDSKDVEFKYQIKNNSTLIDDYSFSNSHFNSSNFINFISIYYSGFNECYALLKFEIHDDFGGMSYEAGPTDLTHGWNELEVHRDGWMT